MLPLGRANTFALLSLTRICQNAKCKIQNWQTPQAQCASSPNLGEQFLGSVGNLESLGNLGNSYNSYNSYISYKIIKVPKLPKLPKFPNLPTKKRRSSFLNSFSWGD